MSFLQVSCFILDNGRLPVQITYDQSEKSTSLLSLVMLVFHRDPAPELDQRVALHMAWLSDFHHLRLSALSHQCGFFPRNDCRVLQG